jgi:hypothetical protein
MLGDCQFDGELSPALAAAELLGRACLKLGRRRPRESLSLFASAKAGFESLHRPRPAALAASYAVEAYAQLGDHTAASLSAAAALQFFKAAGCRQDTLEALVKLQDLLKQEVIDLTAVIATVRRIGRENGGWLPE